MLPDIFTNLRKKGEVFARQQKNHSKNEPQEGKETRVAGGCGY